MSKPNNSEHEEQSNSIQPVIRKDIQLSFGCFTEFNDRDDTRVIVLKGSHSSGQSFFLNTINEQFQSDDFQAFYLSDADKTLNSYFNQIFTQLLSHSDHKKEFSDFIAKQKGSGQVENVLRTLAVCIPIIGPAFGVVEHAGRKHLSSLNNEIHILNIGAEYLSEVSKQKPIIISIELCPNDLSRVREFLARFASDVFNKIKFVISTRNVSDQNILDRLVVNLETNGYGYREVSFPKPNSDFVSELYHNHGISISKAEAEKIVTKEGGNIYRLLRGVYSLKKSKSVGDIVFSQLDHKPCPLEKKVIGFLAVAEQALPESELIELILTSEDLFVEDSQSLRPTIDNLANLGILKVFDLGHDRSISLVIEEKSKLIATETSRVDYFLLSQQLFSYFDKRFEPELGVASLKYAALLYRLAAICDQDRRSEFGQALLRYSVLMQNFSELEPKLPNLLTKDETTNYENFVLSILYKVAMKDYSSALKILSTPPKADWLERHACVVMEAICNNRLRNHQRADTLLKEVSSSAKSQEELIVLYGYRIANYLHWGQAGNARNFYENNVGKCTNAENFGYFLRNAAAAFDRNTKLKMELKAAEFFTQKNHHYGQFSSLVNAGATQMAMDNYEESLRLINLARPELEKYGIQNSVIVTFNDMAVKTFMGDLDDAEKQLKRFSLQPDHNISMTEMYKAFYETLIYYRRGEFDDAKFGVKRIQTLLNETKMYRAKERLYSNNLALAIGLGFEKEEVIQMLTIARDWFDKRDPETTERIIGYAEKWLSNQVKSNQEEIIELICPPYFAYWYMDEIALLSRAWFSS